MCSRKSQALWGSTGKGGGTQLRMLTSCACMQKCPFDAIMIINLPKNLERETTHRYGPNSFKLHRCLLRHCLSFLYTVKPAAKDLSVIIAVLSALSKVHQVRWRLCGGAVCRLPVPRPGQVLGLVGTNGIGKSTALKVLAGKLKPNLGRFDVSLLISCCPEI